MWIRTVWDELLNTESGLVIKPAHNAKVGTTGVVSVLGNKTTPLTTSANGADSKAIIDDIAHSLREKGLMAYDFLEWKDEESRFSSKATGWE